MALSNRRSPARRLDWWHTAGSSKWASWQRIARGPVPWQAGRLPRRQSLFRASRIGARAIGRALVTRLAVIKSVNGDMGGVIET